MSSRQAAAIDGTAAPSQSKESPPPLPLPPSTNSSTAALQSLAAARNATAAAVAASPQGVGSVSSGGSILQNALSGGRSSHSITNSTNFAPTLAQLLTNPGGGPNEPVVAVAAAAAAVSSASSSAAAAAASTAAQVLTLSNLLANPKVYLEHFEPRGVSVESLRLTAMQPQLDWNRPNDSNATLLTRMNLIVFKTTKQKMASTLQGHAAPSCDRGDHGSDDVILLVMEMANYGNRSVNDSLLLLLLL